MNHAQEAARVMSTMPSGDTLDQAYAYAQVHATLALVEQQWIANLISYLEYVDVDTYELLWNSIDEALGLGDQK